MAWKLEELHQAFLYWFPATPTSRLSINAGTQLNSTDLTVLSVHFSLFIPAMSFRSPFAIPRRVWANAATSAMRPMPRNCLAFGGNQRYGMATAVPPVTQDATGSKGPTAMVFLNMGGPSTTAEVEDFLGRLFVRAK